LKLINNESQLIAGSVGAIYLLNPQTLETIQKFSVGGLRCMYMKATQDDQNTLLFNQGGSLHIFDNKARKINPIQKQLLPKGQYAYQFLII